MLPVILEEKFRCSETSYIYKRFVIFGPTDFRCMDSKKDIQFNNKISDWDLDRRDQGVFLKDTEFEYQDESYEYSVFLNFGRSGFRSKEESPNLAGE